MVRHASPQPRPLLWPAPNTAAPLALTREQFNALVVGLPWQRLQQLQIITRV
jgi:hypothetical protein